MRTKVIGSIFILALFASGQNLLQNPGFETWVGGMPDNWHKDDSIMIYQEDVIVHGGNFSVRDSLFTQVQATADFYQTVPFTPNTQCTMNVWVYDNDPAGRIGIGIYWYPSGSYWPNIFSVDGTSWQMLSLVTTSPSDAESATVDLRAYDVSTSWDGDAILYIDDVFFGTSSVQAPVIVRSWHTPTTPGSGIPVSVYAYVVDDGTITYDTLYYGVNNLQSPIALQHVSVVNDTFLYNIPGQATGDTVYYCSKFIDNDGLSVISDTHSYFVGATAARINEVYYDTPGGDFLCFTEIHGPGGTSLDGYTLVGVNGYDGNVYATIDLTGQTIPGDGFFVVGDDAGVTNVDLVDPLANLQNGPDNVELRYHSITIDAVGYGTLDGWVFTGEWLPTADVSEGHSIGRYPDGDDTDNNAVDFLDYETPTPGTPNPVGIVEQEVVSVPVALPIFTNPVRSGIALTAVLRDRLYYPLVVYNAVGQRVTSVETIESEATLGAGIYFIRLSRANDRCVKLVVVD